MNQISGWVREAQSGNRYALNQLIDHYQNDIFRFVYYRIHNQADAEDLTQDIFIQVIKRINTVKDHTLFKAWLYRLASNRVTDFFRKKRILFFMGTTKDLESESCETHDDHSPETEIYKKEFTILLKAFSKDLSKWEREIFLMRFIDDLEVKEIAQILSKNENTVKTHLYRALQKFKKHRKFRDFLNVAKG
jgi:RNA polymerase sigma-70 factor (ECF subfamily)